MFQFLVASYQNNKLDVYSYRLTCDVIGQSTAPHFPRADLSAQGALLVAWRRFGMNWAAARAATHDDRGGVRSDVSASSNRPASTKWTW